MRRHGKAIALSAGAYGAAIVVFGLADALPLALVALAAAGAADMSSVIFRQTLWNQTIPDHMRGRLAGIEQLSYSIGPTLGTARSGAVASVTSVPFSIVVGRRGVRRGNRDPVAAAAALLAVRGRRARACVALTPERVDRRRWQGRRGGDSAPARTHPEDAASGDENAFCVSA